MNRKSSAEDEAGRRQLLSAWRAGFYHHYRCLNARRKRWRIWRPPLTIPELVAAFKCMASAASFAYRPPAVKSPRAGERRILASPAVRRVLRNEVRHEHFTGSRCVVPVMDLNAGRIPRDVSCGRKIGNDLRPGTAIAPLPARRSRRCVECSQALIGSSPVILRESLIDAMSFWAKPGSSNVAACLQGWNGFTGEMQYRAAGTALAQVPIAYDNDPAGNEASGETGFFQPLTGSPRSAYTFPAGHDATAICARWRSRNRRSVCWRCWMGPCRWGIWRTWRASRRRPAPEPAHLTPLAADVAALPAVSALRRVSARKTPADGELMVALPGER